MAVEQQEDPCRIELSLCGHILTEEIIEQNELTEQQMLAIFHDSDYLVPFESYLESMDSLIGNERMLVCIED